MFNKTEKDERAYLKQVIENSEENTPIRHKVVCAHHMCASRKRIGV